MLTDHQHLALVICDHPSRAMRFLHQFQFISRELKCYLVAWEQDQPQDVSAGPIKYYWDKSAAKWAKNF
jgi:hypothetical protein